MAVGRHRHTPIAVTVKGSRALVKVYTDVHLRVEQANACYGMGLEPVVAVVLHSLSYLCVRACMYCWFGWLSAVHMHINCWGCQVKACTGVWTYGPWCPIPSLPQSDSPYDVLVVPYHAAQDRRLKNIQHVDDVREHLFPERAHMFICSRCKGKMLGHIALLIRDLLQHCEKEGHVSVKHMQDTWVRTA